LLAALRHYWGYTSFRPMQEHIIGNLLAKRDVCVIMPTGGGKSLCYQLPAAILSGQTAIVISPLIALMQDQVAQLSQMGIPSALLNSSLTANQQSLVQRKTRRGDYRLLYLSPERLSREDTIEWLQQVPISFFAIDEAHCISEWGHEFRPEYRQLNRLRPQFPDRPIAAFTASATRRVRHDIIDQLQLRDPDKYIASFHRPNLRYAAKVCDGRTQLKLLARALEHYRSGNIIVYASTIARVEETVDFLEEEGIRAIAYHGRMDAETRRRNQERWMSDEVRVLIGTLAFGLGINKEAVRAVIHLPLPKSIEQYYQEAGRAGRDGQPADCVLLWRKRDVGLLVHFVKEIDDFVERERGWQRFHEIQDFAKSTRCRHLQICNHFGETPKWRMCGSCDACGSVPEWLSSYSEGPSRTMAPDRKSIGQDKPKQHRKQRSAQPAFAGNPDPSAGDPELRECLRQWRREVAKRQGVPAFVVMHDLTLDDLCRKKPASAAELRLVHGIGERKAQQFGQQILEVLERFRG
jgi:ATP-dependent DNA helicase RecQ